MNKSLFSGWLTKCVVIVVLIFMVSCKPYSQSAEKMIPTENGDRSDQEMESQDQKFSESRKHMVENQLVSRDIVNEQVLRAMRTVPRHMFIPEGARGYAYDDTPLPIGEDQTISQPYIVALMTQLVDPQPHHKALDIGTGSGYQAAVLAELVKNVYSIEIIESLATTARERLQTLEYKNIKVRHGDGFQGWESEAPFDIIIVAAAPEQIPQPLIDQLAPGGKLVIPVGDRNQTLVIVEKSEDGSVTKRDVALVRFVPMTGEADK